ncbi:hypothetical protein FGO68_gene3300 [Halteria grandinella]|uniref:Uncharacterized protein n=1 Tax=Halteria grandinella TaxID=5974 RepID=A0A8J8T4K8_HALGN|nr:hypothetical protein FGO68_gene3300 [Halteria grandinella]
MELIFTGAKYRLGRIKSKYIIIQILLDNLDRISALMFLAKTSRTFRGIIMEAPSMIQRRLLKANKAITTCSEYYKFCLQQWTQGHPEVIMHSNQLIQCLFRNSSSQLNVTASNIEQLRVLAKFTEERGYSKVKCLTIIADIGFTWKDEEFRQLIKIIAPKEQNIGMKLLNLQLQHPIKFNDAVPPSVEVLRLSLKFQWSSSQENEEKTEALKVNYLCITIQEPYELKFFLRKIQPQVMLIIDLSRDCDKTFFDRLVKDKTLDGFPVEVVFTLDESIEITEAILRRFEKIQVAKKYLLGKKFNMKHVGNKYIETHKERLIELFNDNKNFRRFMGDEFDTLQIQWCARERQLRQTMNIPIPRKSLQFESYDNLYPDFFFTNVVDRSISSKRINQYRQLIDNDTDYHTKQLLINLRRDSKSSLKYQLKYFLRKCCNLERLCLKLENMISVDNPRYSDDSIKVSEIMNQQVRKLKKLEINFDENYHPRQRNKEFPEEIVFQLFLQILEEAKCTLDTLLLNISWNTIQQSEPQKQAEVNKALLKKFIPQNNKLKKLTLLANQIDEELSRILLDQSHFPHLKSLTLMCNQMDEDDDCIPYLFSLLARPLKKLRFFNCSEFDSKNNLFLEQIILHLSPEIRLLHLEETILSIDDCMRILSSKQRGNGFTFKVVNNRRHILDEEIEQLCQAFPYYCILIHCTPL